MHRTPASICAVHHVKGGTKCCFMDIFSFCLVLYRVCARGTSLRGKMVFGKLSISDNVDTVLAAGSGSILRD